MTLAENAALACALFGYDRRRRRIQRMYFDRRLWELTRGMRGRILLAILLGLLAAGFGIARFALLGALLARVFTGAGFAAIALAATGVGLAVLLRRFLHHTRTVIAHPTPSHVPGDLPGRLYDKIPQLGPAPFPRRPSPPLPL